MAFRKGGHGKMDTVPTPDNPEEEKPVQLRNLPSVERVLSSKRIRTLTEEYTREWVTNLVRKEIEEARLSILNGQTAPSQEDIATSVANKIEAIGQAWPRPVINATGVIIHTNLGRAPLSLEAMEAVIQASEGYNDLELDIEEGKRGSRFSHIQRLLCQLTGAEAALVVNNNASAVLLALFSLVSGKEVIVSRGEALEIGGGFRVPDVLRQSGATLVDVGTTNRTYVSDYEAAVTENTGVILKVHSSNFRVQGFAHATEVEELVDMGNRYDIPVLHDIGSGCLLNTEDFGLAHEPTPQENISAGAGLVFFSGDKLLGGPQAGIVVGKESLIQKMGRHPLARAVRIDKICLAALYTTLLHYVKGEAATKIPIWRMINTTSGQLEDRAYHWQIVVGKRGSVAKGRSTVGGGSLPEETLETWLLVLDCQGIVGGAEAVAKRLRDNNPPVVSRIQDDRVELDPRTVFVEEEDSLLRAVQDALI